jgi:hypothetical protein
VAKVLIGVLSCERDAKFHQQFRDMCLKGCPVDHRFFVAGSCPVDGSDVVRLAAEDSNGPEKVRLMHRWTLESDYDFLFKCDIDTFIHVPRLLASNFEAYDWTGGGSPQRPYGGSGYWLSRKAMTSLKNGEEFNTLRPWDEDWYVGDNLTKFGFKAHIDSRYHSKTNIGPEPSNDIITSHWYAEHQSFSGPVAPPPRLIFASERLSQFPKYFLKAQEIA